MNITRMRERGVLTYCHNNVHPLRLCVLLSSRCDVNVRTGVAFHSSKRIGRGGNSPFEVNRRMVLAAREIGCGQKALQVSVVTCALVHVVYFVFSTFRN